MTLLPVAYDHLPSVQHEAHVFMTAYHWKHIARRCAFCYTQLRNGECLTKGCRKPGSGFEQRRDPPEGTCRCGAKTQRWFIVSLKQVPGSVYDWIPGYEARCDGCEQVRTDAQARALAAKRS